MPTFGTLAIHLALLGTAVAAALFFRAPALRGRGLRSARAMALSVAAFLSTALSLLTLAALSHDFRIEYIVSYTDRTTSLVYVATSVWAGQSGSLLVWATILAWLVVGLSAGLRRNAPELEPVACASTLMLLSFFCVVLVGFSNPFLVVDSPPVDGHGLNPLLRNVLMIVHPPALLAGYVFYAAPAAIAIAGVVHGELGTRALQALRFWSVLAWVLLTVGNVLGMVWAYGELGWGGYWGWDPVENAAFIPWLSGTALLHVILAERRTSSMAGWSALLALVTLWLTILGTYLTRSGAVASVHAFGRTAVGDAFAVLLALLLFVFAGVIFFRRHLFAMPSAGRVLTPIVYVACGLVILELSTRFVGGGAELVGPAAILGLSLYWLLPKERSRFPLILASLIICAAVAGLIRPVLWAPMGAAAVVYALAGLRLSAINIEALVAMVLRKSLLFSATLALLALCGGVLLGTVLPLLSQFFVGQPAQVGPEWYVAWSGPAGLVLLALTVLCVPLGWKKLSAKQLVTSHLWSIAAGLCALGGSWFFGLASSPLALLALALAAALAVACVVSAARVVRRSASRVASLGALCAHLGLAALFVGFAGEAGKFEEDITLDLDSPAELEGFRFVLRGLDERRDVERSEIEAVVDVVDTSGARATLRPARHRYRTHPDQPSSEADFWSTADRDLFFALGRVDREHERVGLRVVMTPLLPWVWLGCVILTLGGLIVMATWLRRPRGRSWIVTAVIGAIAVLLWVAWQPFFAVAALTVALTVVAMYGLAQALIRPLFGLRTGPARASCPSCGAPLVSQSIFCHKCGAEVARHEK